MIRRPRSVLLAGAALLIVSFLAIPASARADEASTSGASSSSSVPYPQLIGSGVCLLGAAGAKDGSATAGWATLGIGLGIWAAWDWWIGPSLARSKRYAPAREIKPSAGLWPAPAWPPSPAGLHGWAGSGTRSP